MLRSTGFNMQRFRRFRSELLARTRGPLNGVYRQWGTRYLAWTRKLFVIKSKGGAADGVKWPDLAASTIAARRAATRKHKKTRGSGYRKRGPGSYAILRDTGVLLKALWLGSPGNLFRILYRGVRIGFANVKRHRDGNLTIQEIAKRHQRGGKNLPKRQILHWPDSQLQREMLADLKRGIEKIGRKLR